MIEWIEVIYLISIVLMRTVCGLSPCDYEKNPETGCDRSLMTICDTVTKKCICKSGYPIEVNGRCFEYKSVGEECITSSQCFKAKCVDGVTGDEIISEEGVVNTKKGVCKCTEDRFFDPESRECLQRFIVRRCFFNYECFRQNSYCNRSKCNCKSGYMYDSLSDKCLSNPLGIMCWNGYISENGTKVCRPLIPSGPGSDTRYPYFRRPTYVNFMWPVFAFVLVILMFKLLKEGLERECPVPPGMSPCPASAGSRIIDDSHIPTNLIHSSNYRRSLRLIRPPASNSLGSGSLGSGSLGSGSLGSSNRSAVNPLSLSSTSASTLMAHRLNLNTSPSIDTIVSMPPPYESHLSSPVQVIPNEQPPSYEEATRVK